MNPTPSPRTAAASFVTQPQDQAPTDDSDLVKVEPLFECLADADTDEERHE